MIHGIDGYFLERARAARRVALLSAALGASFLALLLSAARSPAVREAIRQTAHMGYEGERQFVVRVSLERPGRMSDQLRDLGSIVTRSASKGGNLAVIGDDPRARPHMRPQISGPGDAERDLLARAVRRAGNIPVLQSDELVIDHSVVPQYPEALREQNVEGKVTLQALIDTVGKVVDVAVLASTGEPLFEQAAATAVLQYRFRPYRVLGEASEVYAVVRFSFRLY